MTESEQNSADPDFARVAAEQRVITAYHEAGHAVMALILGRTIHKITIAPSHIQTGGVRLGACQMQRQRAARNELEDEVLFLLAGMVAESHLTDNYCRHGAARDLSAVRRLLYQRGGSDRQLQRLERRLLDKTEYLLGHPGHAQAIKCIARELLERITISGRAARHLFEVAIASATT